MVPLDSRKEERSSQDAVQEFLAQANKARSKYQQMLVTPPTSPTPPSHSSSELPAPSPEEPAGCFTDVSFAGSFASWQSPTEEERSRGGSKEESGTFTEISYAGSFASKSSSSSCSPVQTEEPAPAPVQPSPRLRRRQRREQLLQEHKTLGREIVLTALKGVEGREGEEEKRSGEGGLEEERQEAEDQQLRRMVGEREEEIRDLRAACEGWRGKTLALERELSEANFTVDKLERSLRTIEARQEELDESHHSFAGEMRSRESAMEQLREGLQEMRTRCVRKEQEVAERDAMIQEKEAALRRLEEQLGRMEEEGGREGEGEVEELRLQLTSLDSEREECQRHLVTLRAAHRGELETLEQQKEEVRFQLTKRVKALEDELERTQDEASTISKHQHLLEEKLTKLNTQTEHEVTISKLRTEVKRKEALLHDAQVQIEQREADSSGKMLVRQLKLQVEEAAAEITSGLRVRKNLELELADVTAQLEEVSRARAATETRLLEQARENARLSGRLGEQEEELGQLMKQYKASAASVATYMISLQDQAARLQVLQQERDRERGLAGELRARVGELEGAERERMGERGRREAELTRKLDLEETARRRAETRVCRLMVEVEEGQRRGAEEERKRCDVEERHQQVVREVRRLGEEQVALQTSVTQAREVRAVLEARLQVAQGETSQVGEVESRYDLDTSTQVRQSLDVERRRVAALQLALQESEVESDSSSGGDSLEQVRLLHLSVLCILSLLFYLLFQLTI